MKKTPEQLIRAEIRALAAYHVPPSAGMLKLDAMENPYSLPEAMRTELGHALGQAPINRYPDASHDALKAVLRQAIDVPPEAEILLGNGSDEIIQIIALALAQPGAVLLAPEPSFVLYKMVAAFCGYRYVGVPLNADFSLNLSATLQAVERHQPALVFIAYPNNPTGNLFPVSDIEAIIQTAPGLVVVDEAYFPFHDSSFLTRLDSHLNLVVMRTVSKLGLAGIRLGFLTGRKQWLHEFEKLRLPYNINVFTQLAAEILLPHLEALREQTQAIRRERASLMQQLAAIARVEVFPSAANFVLFRTAGAKAVFQGLAQRDILIKNLSASHPLLQDCLRVTVGTPEENALFIRALRECIAH
jgi:histidinol-phosphate aminotransferase